MLEGGAVAVSNDQVPSNKLVRQMEERIRELERQLRRKTLEVEILKESLDKSRAINRPGLRDRCSGTVLGEGCGRDPGRGPI
jgi:transposase